MTVTSLKRCTFHFLTMNLHSTTFPTNQQRKSLTEIRIEVFPCFFFCSYNVNSKITLSVYFGVRCDICWLVAQLGYRLTTRTVTGHTIESLHIRNPEMSNLVENYTTPLNTYTKALHHSSNLTDKNT